MPILTSSERNVHLPRMYQVQQFFSEEKISDISECLLAQLEQAAAVDIIRKSKSIAIAVGSRGVTRIDEIVATLVSYLQQFETEIFIVPAMGSHGGATSDGQAAILESYGISEQTMGVPVRSSMEVVQIGKSDDGTSIYFDKLAAEADLIIPVNRIKPHTDFRGGIESGLCKMITIGLGNHEGCSSIHRRGFDAFAGLIPEIAHFVLQNMRIGFGIGIIENAYKQIHSLEVIYNDNLIEREKELLLCAKRLMPGILLNPPVDILIVQEMGKDISGSGMDPNVIGRTTKGVFQGFSGPLPSRIIVLNLSKMTKGNGLGIGVADFTLEKTAKELDFESMNTNAVASGHPEAARIPMALHDEREAVLAALKCIPQCHIESPRIVRIKNTLSLEYLDVSENFLDEVAKNDRLELVGPATSQF